jgi:hypothetical protein
LLRSLRPRRRRNRDSEELWTPDTAEGEGENENENEALTDEHWMQYETTYATDLSAPEKAWPGASELQMPAPDFGELSSYQAAPAGHQHAEPGDQLVLDREALRELGVPAVWTHHLRAGDRFTSIVALLDRLPQLEIADDVNVIAVVGPADIVELEAHRTALDLPSGGRPRAVAVVPESGFERRSAIAASKRTRPVVVAIAVEGYDDPAETRKVLAQVKAESVIAVIEASRPLAETTRWIESLEKVDAIAIDGALDSSRPAEVLNLGVPVIRLDGIGVDQIGWAALLCAQLTALDAERDSITQ